MLNNLYSSTDQTGGVVNGSWKGGSLKGLTDTQAHTQTHLGPWTPIAVGDDSSTMR